MEEQDQSSGIILCEYNNDNNNDNKSPEPIKKNRKMPLYTMNNHFMNTLSQFEGKQEIPNNVLQQIEIKLKDNKLPVTKLAVRCILKELKLHRYYDKIQSILNYLHKDNQLTKITLDDPAECSVCFEEVKEFIKLNCNHSFCELCINKIEENNHIICPLCRQEFDIVELYNLSPEDKEIIFTEFKQNADHYRYYENPNNMKYGGRIKFRSFHEIIQIIAEKKGIKLNL